MLQKLRIISAKQLAISKQVPPLLERRGDQQRLRRGERAEDHLRRQLRRHRLQVLADGHDRHLRIRVEQRPNHKVRRLIATE